MRDTVRIDCCPTSEEPVHLTYLGVGGWLIRMGEASLLTAPLFSNPDLLDAGFTSIAADPARIDRHLPDVTGVRAILVGHGHYDHLMDVPWIVKHRAPEAIVYANRTSAFQVAPFGLAERRLRERPDGELEAEPPDSVAFGAEGAMSGEAAGKESRVVVLRKAFAGSEEASGRWIRTAPRVRVMPLVSDHAAHFAGVTLYAGVRTRPMPRPPRSAEEWLDGETFAFLIDFLNRDGSVAMRIYYQDAVAAPPFGLVPPLDDGHGIDLAILVPATYAEVDWHPEAVLDDARPRHVLLGHWEDFFQNPDPPHEPVMFTLLEDFRGRLERALPDGSGYHLPMPGTRFLVR